ncbi:cysteine--tRNA ligase [Actinoplanes cyaneus]|uniref:Cysteine--tRNA ligase n=1 Tax=Actinoplanes cyaneus TaxID=52696 RepID=A0A919IJK0_9ACTN|nr:cysteine--tRNA ligase [Actinoplanes cyaneus]MCW2138655.1 cysteinyl-tRNA synthetase [Actinoplanes cyaneus]GID66618.1 cysteine--tRNA ligase [Actinoplanes cyaneus]
MTLRLYDTATRSVRDFVPLTPGQVGIYLCGVTVQSSPHIGHLRSAVNYDVLRRWLLHTGLEVTFIRNVTDVDDKILQKSLEQKRPYWSIAYENRLLLDRDYRALNVLPPTYEPLATGHITEMHDLITALIERGHAYPASAGNGDVYFDVLSFPEYGSLSGQKPEDMRSAEDAPERDKRDLRDFALWKGVKADEPQDAYWPSPWGRGRPGWHIECSAMARRYLGDEFDIHGGGLDLTFPHHENELAQSKAAGLGFSRFWAHHALLNLGKSKMSKSLGNVIDLPAVVESGIRPVELRYYLGSPHYRSRIDYTDEALNEAAVAYKRIEGFVHRAAEIVGPGRPKAVPPAFAEAMNDDLNTSAALAVVHDTIREGNTALAAGDEPAIRGALTAVRAMLGVLGLDPLDAGWGSGDRGNDLKPVVDGLVALAMEQRAQARARKDWAAADQVRDQLKNAGIQVEDTPAGPRWTVGEQH